MSVPSDPEAPNLQPLREALEDVAHALDLLDTLARTLNLIDLPEITRATEALVATGRAIVAAHTPDPDDQVTRQLVTLNDRIEALTIPSRDPKLGLSNTLRELQDAWGRVGIRLRNAIAAAKALGWEPGPAPRATAIVRRDEAAADFAEIANRLHGIERELRSLRSAAENPPSPTEQRGAINIHVGKITPEIKLALLQVELGTAANLDTLSRIAEAVSTLTLRFRSWLAGLRDRIAQPIHRAAAAVRSAVERMVGAVAATADHAARRRAAPQPPPQPAPIRLPPEFSVAEAMRLIGQDKAPPNDWAPFLTALDLGGSRLTTLTPLAALANLQSLNLADTPVTDFTPLAALANLQSLDISNTKVSDLTPIAALANLQSLVFGNASPTDFSPLATLPKLQELDLWGAEISDFTSIGALTSLRSINLSYTNIVDLTPLAAMTNLQSVWLTGTKATDITPLADLANLQSIHLQNTEVTDLHPLAALANLQSLTLRNTKVTDLTPLVALDKLQHLDLWNTQVTDLTPLAALANLQSLELTGTKVTDLTPLVVLANLQSLNLDSTKVTDLTPLAALPNLKRLDLTGLPEGIEAALPRRAEIDIIRR